MSHDWCHKAEEVSVITFVIAIVYSLHTHVHTHTKIRNVNKSKGYQTQQQFSINIHMWRSGKFKGEMVCRGTSIQCCWSDVKEKFRRRKVFWFWKALTPSSRTLYEHIRSSNPFLWFSTDLIILFLIWKHKERI